MGRQRKCSITAQTTIGEAEVGRTRHLWSPHPRPIHQISPMPMIASAILTINM